MKKIFLFLACVCSFSFAHGQDIDWTKTHGWKMYLVNKLADMVRVPLDSLSSYDSISIDQPVMMQYLRSVSKIQDEKVYWEGGYLCTTKTESGKTIKVMVSWSGGSFFLASGNGYYEIPEDQRTGWLSYMHDNWTVLLNDGRKKGYVR